MKCNRISITIVLALALFTLVLVSICSAQQNTTKLGGGPDTVVNCANAKTNYIPVFTSAAPPNITICNSLMYQANGNIGIGTTSPAASLDVNGAINTSSHYQIGGTTVVSVDFTNNNLFLGRGAGSSSAGGYQNTFVGDLAGVSNAGGQGNAFFGTGAGYNSNGYYNTFLGSGSGYTNTTGSRNTFVGKETGHYSTGDDNTFIGAYNGPSNSTGSYNACVGSAACRYNDTGRYNISLGYFAGGYNTSGSSNIYIGNYGPSSGNESNAIRIGTQGNGDGQQNAAYMAGIYGSTASGGVPVYVNSNGQLGTSASSLRFKEQVRDMGDSTNALMKLRPVTFFYKPEYSDGERTLQYGLIAEEVAKVYPELVAYGKDGQPYSVRYQYLTTMLLNEAQKQYRRAEAEAKVIQQLEERLSRLEKLVGSQLEVVAQK